MRLYSFNNTKATMAALLCVAFVALVAAGCQGRTRESMQPTGDTVTVDLQRNQDEKNNHSDEEVVETPNLTDGVDPADEDQETTLDEIAEDAPPVNPI